MSNIFRNNMTELEKQSLEAWRINNQINIMLIESLSDEMLKASLSERGGRDVARQLAHVIEVRCTRLESIAKKSGITLTRFEKGESPDKEKLLLAMKQSGEAMEKHLIASFDNNAAVTNFQRGAGVMLGYYIAHESHHRGSILLTIKKCGLKIPENLKWGIWEWNKI
ncbi:MAG: hypothetical protein HW421_2711 [Ignavibacteria bacterium]|nr:hypothetical protein [Ignavibacteria bacterium]